LTHAIAANWAHRDVIRAAGMVEATTDGEEAHGPKRLVLVIDDDDTALNLMRRRLAQRGYRVLTARSGDEGIALARTERPDLILLDIFMPGKSGYDVLDEIRSDEAIRATPVIVTTVDDDRMKGIRLGATDYLMKPISQDQLGNVLSVYYDRIDGEILVIDGDAASGAGIARMAAQLGLRSRIAADGPEGMRMLRERAPAAVILDLTPPGMTAFEILALMRRTADFVAIPVMIVSSRPLSVSEHEAITGAGCAYFTRGDFSPLQMARELKLALAA
jgi:DNA-binding response OmpR family regulator